jgi:hypothetical protein
MGRKARWRATLAAAILAALPLSGALPAAAAAPIPVCPAGCDYTSIQAAINAAASGNQNTNGLLRQYYPPSTDVRAITQSELDAVAAELNDRPRQTLEWKSPCQTLDQALR